MTKNEFKTALKRAEDLIDDANDIFGEIIRELSISRNDNDIEDLQDALFDMYPDHTGWCKSANKIFTEYCDLFDNDADVND